jgi:hypothetical protein
MAEQLRARALPGSAWLADEIAEDYEGLDDSLTKAP